MSQGMEENVDQNIPSQNLEEKGGLREEEEPSLCSRDQETNSGELSIKSVNIGPSSCGGQDSGLSSTEGSSQCQSVPSKGMMSSPYITSTPKKGLEFAESVNRYEVLPSQMILDDPLLSSIDEPGGDLTDQEVNSLTSDEESEDSYSTRLYETKIRANLDSTSRNCSLMSRLMSSGSSGPKVRGSHSFSETLKHEIIQPDLLTVKKNLFDIPVSPKLKSRVRQRLYTLVNSIDGYKGKVNIENEENRLCNSCEANNSLSNFENVPASTKPKFAICKNDPNISHKASSSTLLSQSVLDRSKSCMCNNTKGQNESINLSHISSHNRDVSEKYGNVMSTMLESQLQTLRLYQEQLSKEKIDFTLQKKEEEADARVALYRDKLCQLVQAVKEMELKLENSEKEKVRITQNFKNKIKQQSERHKESLSLLNMEYEKKALETESTIAAIRMEATKLCDKKVSEVMNCARVRTAATEKVHQDQIFQLNATIAILRAEKREVELRDVNKNINSESNLIDNLLQISKEKDVLKADINILKQRLGPACESDKIIAEQQKRISELELREKSLIEEVAVWRDEAKKWQHKLNDIEVQFERRTKGALEESHKLAQDNLEKLKSDFYLEKSHLNNIVKTLEGKLSDALKDNEELRQKAVRLENKVKEHHEYHNSISDLEREVIVLGSQLRDSVSKLLLEKENLWHLQHKHSKEIAEMKEQHEQEMINYKLSMEKERSLAVSKAMTHREEDTKYLLRGIETRYQELLNTVQAHFKAQIEEYKKAVRILKFKVKKMEERSPI